MPGLGNINIDPQFIDPTGGTISRLAANSPCRDAGNNDADTDADVAGTQPLPGVDLDGRLRFVDDPVAIDTGHGSPPLVDMGAYEYQDDCNENGLLDSVDLFAGSSPDCNETWVPDECELEDNDCNENGIPDECDVAALIVEQPEDVLACPSSTAQFQIDAPGADTYQWYRDGWPLDDSDEMSGTHTDTLTLFDIDAADGAEYWCKAAQGCIAATCERVTLTVVGPLAITVQPAATVRKCNGYTVTFSIDVEATAPSYQWYKDGQALDDDERIFGATTDTLTILNTISADSGGYTCYVWDPCGGAEESAAGELEMVSPVFTLEPVNTCAEVGESAVFTAAATTPPSQTLGWRWKKNGVALSDSAHISGSRTPTLTIHNVIPSDAAVYSALAYSSNPVCLTDSAPGVLTVGDCVTCDTPGDMDGDGDYDLADLREFMLCFGAEMGASPECVCANVLDEDDVVDLADWAELSTMIDGPE
jgi:hypothetical protein